MTDTTTFAFRLPPELKAAAKALTEVVFYRPSRYGSKYADVGYSPRSINDALVTLATFGLVEVAEHIQTALDKTNDELKPLAELMSFFLANPVADSARAPNFAEGSPARALLEADARALLAEQEHDDSLAGIEGGVMSRDTAAQEYAGTQHAILRLTAAKGAIQKALAQ